MAKPAQVLKDIETLKKLGYNPLQLTLLEGIAQAEERKLRGVVEVLGCMKCGTTIELFVEGAQADCKQGHAMKSLWRAKD